MHSGRDVLARGIVDHSAEPAQRGRGIGTVCFTAVPESIFGSENHSGRVYFPVWKIDVVSRKAWHRRLEGVAGELGTVSRQGPKMRRPIRIK